jgi:hypothetical protein
MLSGLGFNGGDPRTFAEILCDNGIFSVSHVEDWSPIVRYVKNFIKEQGIEQPLFSLDLGLLVVREMMSSIDMQCATRGALQLYDGAVVIQPLLQLDVDQVAVVLEELLKNDLIQKEIYRKLLEIQSPTSVMGKNGKSGTKLLDESRRKYVASLLNNQSKHFTLMCPLYTNEMEKEVVEPYHTCMSYCVAFFVLFGANIKRSIIPKMSSPLYLWRLYIAVSDQLLSSGFVALGAAMAWAGTRCLYAELHANKNADQAHIYKLCIQRANLLKKYGNTAGYLVEKSTFSFLLVARHAVRTSLTIELVNELCRTTLSTLWNFESRSDLDEQVNCVTSMLRLVRHIDSRTTVSFPDVFSLLISAVKTLLSSDETEKHLETVIGSIELSTLLTAERHLESSKDILYIFSTLFVVNELSWIPQSWSKADIVDLCARCFTDLRVAECYHDKIVKVIIKVCSFEHSSRDVGLFEKYLKLLPVINKYSGVSSTLNVCGLLVRYGKYCRSMEVDKILVLGLLLNCTKTILLNETGFLLKERMEACIEIVDILISCDFGIDTKLSIKVSCFVQPIIFFRSFVRS